MSTPSPLSRWWKQWLAAGAAVAVLVLAIMYFLRPVAPVASAFRGKAVRNVPGTVEVKAEFIMELKSEVAGRVRSSTLDVGKKVFQNDVLVQLDTGDVDLEIERTKSEIVAARRKVEVGSTLRADVLNARDTFANLERQTKAGAYPQAELDKQRRLLEQSEQKMDLDEVSLKLSLEQFENSLRTQERAKTKMTIVAPSDGMVTDVYARAGDLINNNAPIANIIAISRTVEAKLSEENFAAVKIGQRASVRFLTYGADQYNAVVTKVLPSADPTTQRYTIFLEVHLPEGRVLVPGLTGEVSIVIAERDNAVLIPRRALIGDYVYVVDNGRVSQRQVTKGYESLNQVEILKGLEVGELVVVEQQDRFRDGDRVRTIEYKN